MTEEDMTGGRRQPGKPPGDPDDQRASRARTHRAPGRGRRRILLATAAVGLCAIVTGVSLAAFSSPQGQASQAAGTSSSSQAGTARSPQPTPPVASSSTGPDITSAGIARTTLQYPSALKGQMLRWTRGPGGAAWSAVTSQLGSVTQAGGARMYPQLRLECASLGASVRAARSAPPIPDKAMQTLYARVLAELSVTAADCRNAISVHPVGDEGQEIGVNKVLLSRSLAQFAPESRELYTATAEIRTLQG